MKPDDIPVQWIRGLAAPYLRGYRPRPARTGPLRGYWFSRPVSPPVGRRRHAAAQAREEAGFFVGYLVGTRGYVFLDPQLPECLVFAFVRPVGASHHRRLVAASAGLLRVTYPYLRWLTHRLPRFAFHDDQVPALVRHQSMRDWPAEKRRHFSHNFFIETLAWLVRSGLVRKLLRGAQAR